MNTYRTLVIVIGICIKSCYSFRFSIGPTTSQSRINRLPSPSREFLFSSAYYRGLAGLGFKNEDYFDGFGKTPNVDENKVPYSTDNHLSWLSPPADSPPPSLKGMQGKKDEPLLTLEEQVELYKKQRDDKLRASGELLPEEDEHDWEGRPSSESPFVPVPPPLTEPAFPLDAKVEGGDGKTNNQRKTNIRTFLQQRSVQTLMFLCDKCRDPHTTVWLEDFGGHPNFLKYHGTSAMEVPWDGYFRALLEREKENVVVSVKKRGNGRGGWSKNNPYLKDEWVEFDVEIDPVGLASRLLSIREMLAKEFEHDLLVISRQKNVIFDSYRENVRERGEAGWLYERTTAKLLENDKIQNEGQSSLRFGTFDLLNLLSTQEAVHRVLRANMEGETGKSSQAYEFLRQFYTDRLHYFDGDQPYQRADVFLEELLLTMPSVSKTSSGKVSMTDPMRIAEVIVEMRGEVCKEWSEMMGMASTEHACIRSEILDKRFAQ